VICVLHLERQLHVALHHVSVFSHHCFITKNASRHLLIALAIRCIVLWSCKLRRVHVWVAESIPLKVRPHLRELACWYLLRNLNSCRKLLVLLLDWVGIVISKHRIAAFHRGHHLFALISCHHLRRLLRTLLVCKQLLLKHLFSHLLFLEAHLKLHSLLDLLSLFILVGRINWELHIDRLVRV
jgi:hypothetical protein